jgi:hypothetical protein
MSEYITLFGGAPPTQFTFTDANAITVVSNARFLLYYSLRLFFDNGGGPCWLASIGTYDSAMKAGKQPSDFTGALLELEKILEPAILVAPDAVLLGEPGWQDVCQQFLAHCGKMQSRVSILDIFDGSKGRTFKDDDVINRFRHLTTSDFLSYGQAYYPWVNTGIVDASDLDFSAITEDSLPALVKALTDAFANVPGPTKTAQITLINQMRQALVEANAKAEGTMPPAPPASLAPGTPPNTGTTTTPPAPETPVPTDLTQIHRSLVAVSPTYVQVMHNIQQQLNLLPPSGGMAGVYARVDNTMGVFKAPANTAINSVVSPAVDITNTEQQDLNVPLDGKAINAIRTFPGLGVLIWGARTLDGNSQDWRYINVRRTMIMLEQSIKHACLAYVFEANNAGTWVAVRNMISNFLLNQWNSGSLIGAKPEEAYSVDVGLGSTMTADDILNGFMNVTVKVALVRPAEFIVITIQQKMQTDAGDISGNKT